MLADFINLLNILQISRCNSEHYMKNKLSFIVSKDIFNDALGKFTKNRSFLNRNSYNIFGGNHNADRHGSISYTLVKFFNNRNIYNYKRNSVFIIYMRAFLFIKRCPKEIRFNIKILYKTCNLVPLRFNAVYPTAWFIIINSLNSIVNSFIVAYHFCALPNKIK